MRTEEPYEHSTEENTYKIHVNLIWDCQLYIVFLYCQLPFHREAVPPLHKPLKNKPIQLLQPPLQFGARRMSKTSVCKLQIAWHGLTLVMTVSMLLNFAFRSRSSPLKHIS